MLGNPLPLKSLYCALLCLCVFIFQAGFASAQSVPPGNGAPATGSNASSTVSSLGSSHEWVKVEGPHLDQNSWITLDAMISSAVPSLRDQALDSIESSIRNGETGPTDPNVVNLLASLCLKPTQTKSAPGTEAQPDLPLIRIKALRMAAFLGGDNAYAMFLEVLQSENEPNVLAQAHQGLRQLLRRPGNLEISLIVEHMRGKFPGGAPNALALELLADIQAYHTRWNNLARQDIFDAVLALSQDSRYLETVRNQATAVIKYLMGLQ